ncbi:hypothetical protein Sjap_021147 [Stephania japonica]|uniref:Fungal lipase-type domain-containing protein n=1 Tax=Stephania japonica TaxID=461633 RepID=A0AAP0F787_9MAGN
MASKRDRDVFEISGPLYLSDVNWKSVHHRRVVAASLVQGVYVLERDRVKNRQGSEALAPPWWEFFHFQLLHQLVDNPCIVGAVYEYKPASDCKNSTEGAPRCVIAFRGTITKGYALVQDLKLDLLFIKNRLHPTPRFEIAMQAVRNIVAAYGDLNVWLAGHSLGSAMSMFAGKNMAKSGIFLEAYLFNPPYFSAPIENIKDEEMKHIIRTAKSVIKAGITVATIGRQERTTWEDQFLLLSPWVPNIFVNPGDYICAEYIGYFEHRKTMEEIGAGGIERLATQYTLGGLFLTAIGRQAEEPLHLLPSANLTVNLSQSLDFKQAHGRYLGFKQWYLGFKQAHGIHQWFSPDVTHLQSKLHQWSNTDDGYI